MRHLTPQPLLTDCSPIIDGALVAPQPSRRAIVGLMSEADTSGAEPLRYPIPHGLQRRSAWLAKWMRIVGMFQAGVAGLAFLYLGIVSIAAVFTLGIFSASNIIMLLLLAALAILFRQALLLLAAADHLSDIGGEPEDAHDHLNLAFTRLRPVFMIDLAIGLLMLVGNSLALVMS
jgi:hypothetical protein